MISWSTGVASPTSPLSVRPRLCLITALSAVTVDISFSIDSCYLLAQYKYLRLCSGVTTHAGGDLMAGMADQLAELIGHIH
jgi:hypothetical protein